MRLRSLSMWHGKLKYTNRALSTWIFRIFYMKQRADSQENSIKEWKRHTMSHIFSEYLLYQGHFIWLSQEATLPSAWRANEVSAVVWHSVFAHRLAEYSLPCGGSCYIFECGCRRPSSEQWEPFVVRRTSKLWTKKSQILFFLIKIVCSTRSFRFSSFKR